MEAKTPHQRARRVCSSCLGLEHARLAIDVPSSCQHCAVFTIKSPRRWLARQASLSGLDPYLPLYGTAVKAGEKTGVVAVATPEASTSWASQLDPAAGPQQEEDVLELDCGDDEDVASKLLISEDEQEDDIFVTPAQAVQPAASVASRYGGESSTPASALPSSDMLDMCKRAAAQLAIPWPTVIAETTRSRYQGKKLALAKSATKQLLPVFPELLDEVACSWRDGPHSSRSPISGACALAASKVSQFKMPKLSKPQLAPPPLPSRVSWSKKPSASVAAPPAQPTQAAQGRKKKRAALRPLFSSGDAAGRPPFSSSTCLASKHAPKGPPSPHFPAATACAGAYSGKTDI